MILVKRALAVFLTVQAFLVGQSVAEQAVSIPIGSVVEAKLVDKSKVRGQLISVTQQGVSIRTTDKGAVQEKALAFDQIRSLHAKKQGNTGLKILAGVGIALGSLMVVGLIIAASLD